MTAATAPAADLAGLTVLDLGGIGPSARCVRVLADLGARWIQLVAPAGAGRTEVPWHAYGAQRGAERLAVDLKHPAGRELFLRLAARADVVVECFRPGVAERLGIGWAAVQAANPRAIYCATTGYGQHGPYAAWAGHDLNYQAIGGALAAAGRDAQGAPALPGLTLADSAGGGWMAALRILAALHARQASGRGRFIDASAAAGVLQLMAMQVDEYLATGDAAAPGHGLTNGQYACYGLYRTADGGSLAVAAIEPKFFRTLLDRLGLAELAPLQYDPAAQDTLRAALARVLATRGRDDWMQRLAGHDVCVTPVLAIDEVTRDAHWQATGAFVAYEHPRHGAQRQVGPFDGGDGQARGAAPGAEPAAAHRTLRSLGWTDAEVAALQAQGVLG